MKEKVTDIANNLKNNYFTITTYPLTLGSGSKGRINSPLYFILSSGNEEALQRSLLLVNNELQSINNVLNVLNSQPLHRLLTRFIIFIKGILT